MLRAKILIIRNVLSMLLLTLMINSTIDAQWTTDNNVSWGSTTYDILFPSNEDRTVSIGGPFGLQYKFSVREDDKQFAVFENEGTGAVPVFVVDQSKVGLGDLPFSATTGSALNIDDKLHVFGRGRIQDSDPYLNFEFSDGTGGKAGFRFLNQNAGFTTAPFASILIDQNTDDLTFDMPEDIHFDFLSSTMTLDGFALETSVLQTKWKTSSGDNRARLSFGFGNMLQFGNDIDADVQFVQNGNPIITLDTENNVGVGQAEPLSRLHVNGDMRIEDGNGNLDFYNTSGENLGYIRARADHTGVGHLDSADVRIATNGQFRFYVKGNGSVGVGRMTPEQKLDVNGAIKIDNTNNEVAGSIRFRDTDFEGYDGTEWKSLTDSGASNLWSENAIGDLFTFNRVGIGTQSVGAQLAVAGNMSFKNETTYINFVDANSATTFSRIIADSTDLNLSTLDGRPLLLSTNNTPRVRVTGDGNVIIGWGPSVLQKLSVDGAIRIGDTALEIGGSIRFDGTDFEGYDGTEWKSLTDSGSSGSGPWSTNGGGDIFFNDGASVGIGTSDPVATLHVEGLIAVSEGIIHPSDIRLKEDITPIDDALEIIKQLKPKTYSFKNELVETIGLSEQTQYGLIAQDVEKVLPEIVYGELALNADDNEQYKAIDYDQLVPILIEAVKNLEQQVQQLKAEKSK